MQLCRHASHRTDVQACCGCAAGALEQQRRGGVPGGPAAHERGGDARAAPLRARVRLRHRVQGRLPGAPGAALRAARRLPERRRAGARVSGSPGCCACCGVYPLRRVGWQHLQTACIEPRAVAHAFIALHALLHAWVNALPTAWLSACVAGCTDIGLQLLGVLDVTVRGVHPLCVHKSRHAQRSRFRPHALDSHVLTARGGAQQHRKRLVALYNLIVLISHTADGSRLHADVTFKTRVCRKRQRRLCDLEEPSRNRAVFPQ